MKRKVINIITLVVFLGGIIALAYPYLSFYFAKKKETYVVQDYENKAGEMDPEEVNRIWSQAEEFNENLVFGSIQDPFTKGNANMQEEYANTLKTPGTKAMGYVIIPDIDVMLPIYHGTSKDVLEKGVGHIEGTSLPIGGEGTHSVLSGHTGLPQAKLFTDLIKLKENEEFYIKVLDKVLAYRIDEIVVIEPDDVEWLKQIPSEDRVTLLTCTPYGINSQRLLVKGVRTEYSEKESGKLVKDSLNGQNTTITLLILVTVLSVLLIIFIVFIIRRKKKRREK